jgi:hypothetical protein
MGILNVLRAGRGTSALSRDIPDFLERERERERVGVSLLSCILLPVDCATVSDIAGYLVSFVVFTAFHLFCVAPCMQCFIFQTFRPVHDFLMDSGSGLWSVVHWPLQGVCSLGFSPRARFLLLVARAAALAAGQVDRPCFPLLQRLGCGLKLSVVCSRRCLLCAACLCYYF